MGSFEKKRAYMRDYERKRSAAPLVPDEIIMEIFTCDPNSGQIFKHGLPRPGKKCKGGYVQIDIFGKKVMGHRLIWFLVHGEWPSNLIDHINGNTSDNRIINLRIATPSQNQANGKLRTDNTSGVRGVSKMGHQWKSYLNAGGETIHMKYHYSFIEAVSARRKAVVSYFCEFEHQKELYDTISALIHHGLGDEDISVCLNVPVGTVQQHRRAPSEGEK